MRILFTTHQGGMAGATISITYLARGLAERGHKVHVACEQECLLWHNLEGLKAVELHPVSIRSYFDMKAVKKISSIIQQFDIDLINAQGGKDRNLVILAKWFFRLHCKIVFTRRQRPRDEPWIKRWFHLKGATGIIVVSNGLKEIFVKKGYKDSELTVIHNGVDPELIPKLSDTEKQRLKEGLGLRGKVVGCLSRKKIQQDLIASLKFLPDDITVLFVGVNEADLKTSIQSIKPVQKLVFTGKVPHADALKYLQLMDVNVLASHMEGFGLVLVEAMLSKVPVVASNFGGIPDIVVDHENGFLYQNHQSQELANKIKQLLTDDDLRKYFIENGYNTALDKFGIDKTIQIHELYFKELVGRP